MGHDERAANRAAAERENARRKAKESQLAQETEERRKRIDELHQRAERLIPQALNARSRRGYEGIVQLTRQRKTLFGYKQERIGGYFLCTLMAAAHGEQFPRETFLGSDGSILPWAKNLKEYVDLVRRTEAVDGSGQAPQSGHGVFSITAFRKVVDGLECLAGGGSPRQP